jgi:DNA adenine methylase
MAFYSPLRYPGGKGKVADYFKRIFRENDLCDGTYVEPYAGGASVALALLFNEYASKIVINDLDRSIYAFWHSVLNETEGLCGLIQDTPVDIEQWRYHRSIQKNKGDYSLLDLGFSTFYLNRANRSGIIMAGVIGGVNQNGDWKIDARFNKSELINRIQKIASFKSSIQLHNLDACELMRKISSQLSPNTLIYFDPPYYVKGKDLYVNHYNHKDHSEVAAMIQDLSEFKWVVSYDNLSEIRELYGKHRQLEYSFNYSATHSKPGAEVMIFSDNMTIPNTLNPTKLKESCVG